MSDRRDTQRGTVDRITDPFSQPALLERWEELAERCAAAPWLWPQWFKIWARSFSRDQPLVAYCYVSSGGELAAIGIFVGNRRRLSSAANIHTPWWRIVGDDADARLAVLKAALGDTEQLELLQLPADSVEATTADETGARARRITSTSVREISPSIRAHTDWETFVSTTISRHRRKELARCRRRLREAGPLTYEWLNPTEETVDPLLDLGFRIEGTGWKGRLGTAITADEATAHFYRALARWAASAGWLRLAFLRIGNEAIAFEFALEKHHTLSMIKGGYDESYARFGPGIILLHDLLQDAFIRGVEEIELLGGNDPYKLEWAADERPRMRINFYAHRPRATARYLRERLLLTARNVVRRR